MRGVAVCQTHGGQAPHVKRAAAERIAEMVDPALSALRKLVDTADTDSVRLSAIKDILDRAGYKPKERVEQSGGQVIEIVYSDSNSANPALPPQTTSRPTADYR